ncbi:MAG: MarR family transcriptional regulator [Actinomycetota bacterium]|nr:MarR family transcriptional regulator [Actinomycetota bacterium]
MSSSRPDPVRLAAWRSVLTTRALLVDELDRELHRTHDLPLDWYDVLLQLNEGGGRLRMSELADATLISRSSATRVCHRMEKAGLVRREPDPDDRRGTFAVLTDEGKDMLRTTARTHLDGVERTFACHVTEEEAEVIAAALGRVVDAARARLRS